MPNKILPIQDSSDDRSKTAQINANFAKLDADTVTKTFKGPTGKDAVIEGQLPNNLGSGILMNDLSGLPNIIMATDPSGQPILKVAKPGQNATTAGDDNLIFNSQRNTFKIVATGNATVNYTVPLTTQVFTTVIPHGLGIVPIALAFFDNSSGGRVMIPYDIVGYDTPTGLMHPVMSFRLIVDATNLTLAAVVSNKMPSPGSASFKYYILAESAN